MSFVPYNETERLAAVRRYEILDTPPDGAFDQITALAARVFSVPIAIVSIVDHDRIWFKSHHGVEVQEIGRDPGLCASAILQDSVYTVLDARTDPRALVNPLVAGNFGLRFYAAAPLKTKDGFNLGTLCVIDVHPREFTPSQEATLKDLAAIVMDEMELRLASRKVVQLERTLRAQAVRAIADAEHLASTDKLTGLSNRRALDVELDCYNLCEDDAEFTDVVVAMVDLDGLKVVNDRYGHKHGDGLLVSFANNLRAILRQEDKAYRYGGDEFVLIMPFNNPPDIAKLRQRIALVVERVRQATDFPGVNASVGLSCLSEASSVAEAMHLADKRMYTEKRKRAFSDSATTEFLDQREQCRVFIERRKNK